MPTMTASTDLFESAGGDSPGLTADRWAGLALLTSAVASIAVMAFDANGGGKDALSIMQGMVRTRGVHQAVHVGQMACLSGLLFAHVHLSQRLGLQRLAVKGGLMGYALGVVLMLICTVIDGFIIPDTAGAFVQKSPEMVQAGWSMIEVGYVALTDLARVAWVLEALGVLALSVALVARRGLSRKIGVVGLVAGALQAAAVVAVGSNLSGEVIAGVLGLQAVWYLCAAWLLWKGVPNATPINPSRR